MHVFVVVLVVISLGVSGCDTDTAERRTTQATAVVAEQTADDASFSLLFAAAKSALCYRFGPNVESQLQAAELQLVPHSSLSAGFAIAERRENLVLVAKDIPTTEEELFDTMVHELMHVVTAMQQPDFEQEQPVSIRLRLAVNEAISYKIAAELAAERYGTQPRYTWEYLPPRTGIPRELVIHMVTDMPLEYSLAIAFHPAGAAAFLKELPNTIPVDNSPLVFAN